MVKSGRLRAAAFFFAATQRLNRWSAIAATAVDNAATNDLHRDQDLGYRVNTYAKSRAAPRAFDAVTCAAKALTREKRSRK